MEKNAAKMRRDLRSQHIPMRAMQLDFPAHGLTLRSPSTRTVVSYFGMENQ